jgi:hypothetical protein
MDEVWRESDLSFLPVVFFIYIYIYIFNSSSLLGYPIHAVLFE